MSAPHITVPFQSINALIRSRAESHPDRLVFAAANKQLELSRWTFAAVDAAATLLAEFYASPRGGSLPVRAKGDTTSALTVGLLAPSGFEYIIHELALVRMGYAVLLISINNSPEAIAHLLKQTSSQAVIVHPNFATRVREARDFFPKGYTCRAVDIAPAADGYYRRSKVDQVVRDGSKKWDWRLTEEEEKDLPCFIIHSSGSTGFPKTTSITHAKAINTSRQYILPSIITLPLYHQYGHMILWSAFCSVNPLYLFPASDLPLTSGNLLKFLSHVGTEAKVLLAVPLVFKLLGDSEEGLAAMRKFRFCNYGGSSLPDELGDRLVVAGVNLTGGLGSTEVGSVASSMRDFKTDKGWNYYRFGGKHAVKDIEKYAVFESQGGLGEDEMFELVMKPGWPSTSVPGNRPDGSYATRDVFTRHPTIPYAYKFLGRLDDTLVHTSGEKTNPVPIEFALRASPHLHDAIVFGAGRPQAGALIILSSFLSSPITKTRDELYQLIRPAIDAANSSAPSHSHLQPEALIYLPHDAEIPRADKGSFIRPKVYKLYEREIEGVYRRLNGEEDDGREKREIGGVEDTQKWLMGLVKGIVKDPSGLEIETDLFDFGLDSLQAGRIRLNIQRELDLKGTTLAPNFVFDQPSIRKMSEYLVAVSTGDVSKLQVPSQTEQMLALVEKYRTFEVAQGQNSPTKPSLAKVVLTGATGSLGAYLLALLLQNPSVETVYCPCRGKDDADATKRVQESLRSRRLNVDVNGDKRVVCFTSDLGAERLGLRKELYEKIGLEVTMVIHNAWNVNFNLDISSFEAHIRGAHNLMQLCFLPCTPAYFYFASSVSAAAAWRGKGAIPENIFGPEAALKMGYGRSKWVVERLCQIATAETPLQAGVLRIGQLVGDTLTGVWNESEAVSLLLKSADTLRALPSSFSNTSWLPVDIAAVTILELVAHPFENTEIAPCWHVLMDKEVGWMDVLESLKKAGLDFAVLDGKDWLAKLRTSSDDLARNPTKKLLSFFEDIYARSPSPSAKQQASSDSSQESGFSTKVTRKCSPALAECKVPGDKLIALWVESWRRTGFLQRRVHSKL